jgi:hypothetical protein
MIKFKEERIYKTDHTMGNYYYLDDKYNNGWIWFCNLLERPKIVNGIENVTDLCCILEGTYDFIRTLSDNPKIHYISPILLNVPGRSGIRQHIGNFIEDTEGCQLVGINTKYGEVHNSEITFNKYMDILNNSCQDKWTIEITHTEY